MNHESILDTIKLIACVLIAGALTFFACAAAHYKRIVDTSITQREKNHIEQLQKKGTR